ncbi:hypothetical protein M885DRAFT_558304 [Pelagophyceae sp. CCMP2097]|nr:hypothetical protein M885DRAFT_558304 [Pelagophyceae sp. CCMP2097]
MELGAGDDGSLKHPLLDSRDKWFVTRMNRSGPCSRAAEKHRALAAAPAAEAGRRGCRPRAAASLVVVVVTVGALAAAQVAAARRGAVPAGLAVPFVGWCVVQHTGGGTTPRLLRGLWLAVVWGSELLIAAAPLGWCAGIDARLWPLALYAPLVVRCARRAAAAEGADDETDAADEAEASILGEVVFVECDDVAVVAAPPAKCFDAAARAPQEAAAPRSPLAAVRACLGKRVRACLGRGAGAAPTNAAAAASPCLEGCEELAQRCGGGWACGAAGRTALGALDALDAGIVMRPQRHAALALRWLFDARLFEPFAQAVDSHVLIGSAPLVQEDVDELVARHRVGSVLRVFECGEGAAGPATAGGGGAAVITETVRASRRGTLSLAALKRGVSFVRSRAAAAPQEKIYVYSRDGRALCDEVAVAYVCASQHFGTVQAAADFVERRVGRRVARSNEHLQCFVEEDVLQGWAMVDCCVDRDDAALS